MFAQLAAGRLLTNEERSQIINMSLDVNSIRKQFPIFERETSDGVPLVYLDSTATSQKPLAVIEAMDDYYRRSNANIARRSRRWR